MTYGLTVRTIKFLELDIFFMVTNIEVTNLASEHGFQKITKKIRQINFYEILVYFK